MKNIKASFRDYPSDFYSGVETISISNEESESGSNVMYVIIEELDEFDEGTELINLVMKHDHLIAPFNDIQLFGDFMAIGFGNSVYFFNLKTWGFYHYSLNGYFSSLHIEQEHFYVCSASDIVCFNNQAELMWCSDPLGVDGVQIGQVTAEIISGSAECNPPDGWEDFEISAIDGKRTSPITPEDFEFSAVDDKRTTPPTPVTSPSETNDSPWYKKLSFSRLFNTILTLLFLSTTITLAQTNKRKVRFPYLEACLTINEIPCDARVPYDLTDILLFENDSLFQKVRWLEINTDTFALPQDCLTQPLLRIELLDDARCIYFLDANKKVLAACYPDETHFEMQWFTNGKNSMLKQWEMVTINLEYIEDPEQELIYLSYDETVLVRRIDRSGFPEDFELTITYEDKDSDGHIEKVIAVEENN